MRAPAKSAAVIRRLESAGVGKKAELFVSALLAVGASSDMMPLSWYQTPMPPTSADISYVLLPWKDLHPVQTADVR